MSLEKVFVSGAIHYSAAISPVTVLYISLFLIFGFFFCFSVFVCWLWLDWSIHFNCFSSVLVCLYGFHLSKRISFIFFIVFFAVSPFLVLLFYDTFTRWIDLTCQRQAKYIREKYLTIFVFSFLRNAKKWIRKQMNIIEIFRWRNNMLTRQSYNSSRINISSAIRIPSMIAELVHPVTIFSVWCSLFTASHRFR